MTSLGRTGCALSCALLALTSNASAQRRTDAETDSLLVLAETTSRARLFQHQHINLVEAGVKALNSPLGSRSENLGGPLASPRAFGSCAVAVLHFCYGHDNGGLEPAGLGTTAAQLRYSPKTMPRAFHKVSNKLLNKYVADLADGRKRIPGDRWIAGELVRVALARGFPSRALDEAKDCTSDAWWCAALSAYVMSSAGEWADADSAWDVALGLMPDVERCAWLDPSWAVADGAFRDAARGATCVERIRLAERVWWLSDPMYMYTGNERRAAHLERVAGLIVAAGFQRALTETMSMLTHARGSPTELPMVLTGSEGIFMRDGSFGDPHPPVRERDGIHNDTVFQIDVLSLRSGYPELVMRAGEPHYLAVVPSWADTSQRGLLGIYPRQRHAFVPSAGALLNHLGARDGDWNLTEKNPFEFFANYGRDFVPLESQVAFFRRGDSARVIAASDVPLGLSVGSRSVVAALFMQRDFDLPRRAARGDGARRKIFSLTAPAESTLVSLEMRATGGNIGRTRFASGPQRMPAQRVTLSDVLLIEQLSPLPLSLDEAMPRAKGNTTVSRGGSAGIYWEIYGLRAREKPHISVAAVRVGEGLLGRVARGITLQSAQAAVSVEWDELEAEGRDIEPRSVGVNLSALTAGEYSLHITVTVGGQQPVTSRRDIEIR